MSVGQQFIGLPISFELVTERNTEISETQRIEVKNDGSVTFDALEKQVDAAQAMNVIHTVTAYFREIHPSGVGLVENVWHLAITNDEGNVFHFQGRFGQTLLVGQHNLSDLIREALNLQVWAFDGKTRDVEIKHLELKYYEPIETADWEHDYKEQLILRRSPESIVYETLTTAGAVVTQNIVFKKKQQITRALSVLEQANLVQIAHQQGAPVIQALNKQESTYYHMHITFADDSEAEIVGAFDDKGLPELFADFTYEVQKSLTAHTLGDIFKGGNTHEYIYCSVEFTDGGNTYYYLTDDDSIDVGDHVVVPVGGAGTPKIVEVVDVEYFDEKHLPMPLYKVKKIIQKVKTID